MRWVLNKFYLSHMDAQVGSTVVLSNYNGHTHFGIGHNNSSEISNYVIVFDISTLKAFCYN